MRNPKAVKQLCDTLDGLQGGITLFKDGIDEFLLSHGYPRFLEEIEAVRDALEDIGLYETVRDGVTRSETLVREGRYDEAQMLVLQVNRQLSKASGAEADLKRLYKSADS